MLNFLKAFILNIKARAAITAKTGFQFLDHISTGQYVQHYMCKSTCDINTATIIGCTNNKTPVICPRFLKGHFINCIAQWREIIKEHYFVKVPLTPKCFFSLKWIFAPVQNALRQIFPFSNKFCHFIGFKSCENPSIFCSRPSQKGSGSIPDVTSQTDYIALTLCKHACKVDCDVTSGTDLLPFWLGHEQKMLGFSQLSKPIKWQNWLEKGKNCRNVFRTGAKIHFSEKKHFGTRGTLKLPW